MDYLQEAIERARQQREGSIGKTPSLGAKNTENQAGPAATQRRSQVLSSQSRKRTVRRINSLPKDIEYTATRIVQPDPEVLATNRVIATDREDPRVEAFRQLRSQVLSSMNLNGWNTLAITGPMENVGKTLTAVNLAISLAQEGNQTVLLVDLDLRDPSVAETLGIEVEKGIVDHLRNGEPLEDILVNPGIPRLVVVPGLPQGRHVSELLTSPEMQSFLADIISRYPNRIVVFDLTIRIC